MQQNDSITLYSCPVCGESKFREFITATDYTVSRELFQVVRCQNCQFTFTNPQPDKNALPRYYESQDYVSHSQTNRGLINRLYQQVKGLNLSFKYRKVAPYVPRGTWVDYGAGAGDFVKYLSERSVSGHGFEPNESARKLAATKGITLKSPVEFHNLEDHSIACITLWHVLEHISDLNQTLISLKSKLKPSGILVIAVPNHASFDAIHYGKYWAAYDVPRHLWHFREKDVLTLAQAHGLVHLKTFGMPFDSFYVSMLSEKYKGRPSLLGVIYGLVSNVLAGFSSYPYSSQIYILKKPE